MDILELTYDLKKRTEGVKILLGGDAYLLIAGVDTAEYTATYGKYLNELKESKENAVAAQEALCRALADHVLIGWEGITEKGEEVAYSKDKAFEWLMDPAKEKFFSLIYTEASNFDNFKAEALDTTA